MSRWRALGYVLGWAAARVISSLLLALVVTAIYQWLANGEPHWTWALVYVISLVSFMNAPTEYKSPGP